MPITIRDIAPGDIERESFRIIREEFGPITVDESTFSIICRVIHATGDFAFGRNLVISPRAIETGIEAIRSGKTILTDVSMVAAGISKPLVEKWGGTIRCLIGDSEVASQAKQEGKTRSEVAMQRGLDETVGIVAIGNAPTALLEVLRILERKKPATPPLVIGVPVGFVNAAESKELLLTTNNHFITSRGRKGGSPVAAAITNALLRLV